MSEKKEFPKEQEAIGDESNRVCNSNTPHAKRARKRFPRISSKSLTEPKADKAKKDQKFIVTATTLLNMGISEIPTLLDPVLPKIGIAAIVGSSDTGKSS